MAKLRGAHALKTAGLALLLAAPAAWAGERAKTHGARPAAATQASLAQAKQKLEQQQAQVRQLQDTLAKQETDSRQASQRLQQQDQAITRMQQELQALHARQPDAHR